MIRYGFTIRTKSGQRVDNIQIMAANLGDAERRLRQMYLQCQIIECREQAVPHRVDTGDSAKTPALANTAPPEHKAGTH